MKEARSRRIKGQDSGGRESLPISKQEDVWEDAWGRNQTLETKISHVLEQDYVSLNTASVERKGMGCRA